MGINSGFKGLMVSHEVQFQSLLEGWARHMEHAREFYEWTGKCCSSQRYLCLGSSPISRNTCSFWLLKHGCSSTPSLPPNLAPPDFFLFPRTKLPL